jgi:hypothetical protein
MNSHCDVSAELFIDGETVLNRHFDGLKNKLPYNLSNENASKYYNQKFWLRPECKYGTINSTKSHADKWDTAANEPSDWTDGCSSCDTNTNTHTTYGNSGYDISSEVRCDRDFDTGIVYRAKKWGSAKNNMVELRVPSGSSKEQYLTKTFSPKFIRDNRYQYVVPLYSTRHNNFIDNNREEEFTISDQNSLIKRDINNYIHRHKYLHEYDDEYETDYDYYDNKYYRDEKDLCNYPSTPAGTLYWNKSKNHHLSYDRIKMEINNSELIRHDIAHNYFR